jgi:hypothetical protein
LCRAGLSVCCPVACAAYGRSRARYPPSGFYWSVCCVDGVCGCPRDPAAESPRARTYSGQRHHNKHHPVAFAQFRGHIEAHAGAYCKTVGSAYVGSNPTPATTSENGPRAAETRPGGPFPSCHAMYQAVSLRVDARQWLRTYSGQRPGGTSGAYNRSLCHLMAVRHGKDADRQAKARQPPAPGAARGEPEMVPAVCPRVGPARPAPDSHTLEPTRMLAMLSRPAAGVRGEAARVVVGVMSSTWHVLPVHFSSTFD